MVFSKDAVNGCWKRGKHSLPKVSSYSYLGIDFSSNGAWDMHMHMHMVHMGGESWCTSKDL